MSWNTSGESGSWQSDDRWQDYPAPSDYSSSGSSMDSYPALPSIPSGTIDVGSIAPVFGVSGLDEDGVDYLDYDKAGRPIMEQMSGTCGTAYFTGIVGGGLLGAAQGFRRAPSAKFRIRLNAIMNGAALRGSKSGNAFGCLAMIYKGLEYVVDSTDLDHYARFDQITPIVAASATGVFYKSTAGPRAMILAGALGAGLMTAMQFGVKPFYPRL